MTADMLGGCTRIGFCLGEYRNARWYPVWVSLAISSRCILPSESAGKESFRVAAELDGQCHAEMLYYLFYVIHAGGFVDVV